jgi:hypothetical protein
MGRLRDVKALGVAVGLAACVAAWLGGGAAVSAPAWAQGAGTATGAPAPAQAAAQPSVKIRIATFNLEDVRTADLATGDVPRLKALASAIQRVRPNIILLNEIAYDMPGAPDFALVNASANDDAKPMRGLNAQRFADLYLARAQAEGLTGVRYRAFMRESNTGMASGFDLDNDGRVVTEFPVPPGSGPNGEPGPQTAEGRAYGNDCWGFGTFPGQYAMGLLVDERLVIDEAGARTFRLLPWDYMSGHFMPRKADGTAWYDEEEAAVMRLSSKSHWDVPVRLPNGAVVHMLCAHPTPPAFDGPEQRNKMRNHDEIRFWADYLDGAAYVVDDLGRAGGLRAGAHFVIAGDLNADPDEGSSFKDPIDNVLASHRRIDASFVPRSEVVVDGLDADDTARFGLRVDYVLPSRTLTVVAGGVERGPSPVEYRALRRRGGGGGEGGGAAGANGGEEELVVTDPSDHFLVWIDVVVPAP